MKKSNQEKNGQIGVLVGRTGVRNIEIPLKESKRGMKLYGKKIKLYREGEKSIRRKGGFQMKGKELVKERDSDYEDRTIGSSHLKITNLNTRQTLGGTLEENSLLNSKENCSKYLLQGNLNNKERKEDSNKRYKIDISERKYKQRKRHCCSVINVKGKRKDSVGAGDSLAKEDMIREHIKRWNSKDKDHQADLRYRLNKLNQRKAIMNIKERSVLQKVDSAKEHISALFPTKSNSIKFPDSPCFSRKMNKTASFASSSGQMNLKLMISPKKAGPAIIITDFLQPPKQIFKPESVSSLYNNNNEDPLKSPQQKEQALNSSNKTNPFTLIPCKQEEIKNTIHFGITKDSSEEFILSRKEIKSDQEDSYNTNSFHFSTLSLSSLDLENELEESYYNQAKLDTMRFYIDSNNKIVRFNINSFKRSSIRNASPKKQIAFTFNNNLD